MSTGLARLQLLKELVDRPGLDAGAVAEIRAGYGNKVTREARRRTVIIPTMNAPSAPLEIPLPPGAWSVEVGLPWGGTVTQDFEVVENEPTDVNIQSPQSPHEGLGWLHLQGAVPSADFKRMAEPEPQKAAQSKALMQEILGDKARSLRRTRAAIGATRSAGSSITGAPPQIQVGDLPLEVIERALHESDVAGLSATVSVYGFRDDAQRVDWERIATTDGAISDAPFKDLEVIYNEVSPADDAFVTKRFSLPEVDYDQTPFQRQWIHVEGFGERSLLSVPSPWFPDGGCGGITVVARFFEEDRGFAQLVIDDPDMAALLGYMTDDRLHRAAIMADHAQDRLFGKRLRPLAACCGGYVLLATRLYDEKADQHWRSWITNLNNWFEWMPDGAILEGFMRLNGPRDVRDFDRAAECFDTAVRRGIPFVTLGLPWLLSGLRSLASTHPAFGDAIRLVEPVARLSDTSRPFTTLRLPAEDEP